MCVARRWLEPTKAETKKKEKTEESKCELLRWSVQTVLSDICYIRTLLMRFLFVIWVCLFGALETANTLHPKDSK